MQETLVWFLDLEDALEKKMATHSSILAWEIPWTEEPHRVTAAAAAAAKSLQSCPTLCDSIDGSPPGSPVPGILQARTLEWVAISFSNAWKWKVKVKSLGRVQLLATPWTAAYGSSTHGIFQARVLEWVAIAFSKESSIVEKNKGSGFLYIFFKHEGVLKI